MPYKSDAQRRWAHTLAGKKALGGEAAVHEWDEATKGKKLPEKIGKSLSIPSTNIPSATKMPKAKSMPTALDKPSKFFKKEEFGNIKQSSIEKLRDFLEKQRSKHQS